MFWISAKLTFVMLAVVPPISLGAVSCPVLVIPADTEVFYGRYLRKLSNLTQEAIGDMSKVRGMHHSDHADVRPLRKS